MSFGTFLTKDHLKDLEDTKDIFILQNDTRGIDMND